MTLLEAGRGKRGQGRVMADLLEQKKFVLGQEEKLVDFEAGLMKGRESRCRIRVRAAAQHGSEVEEPPRHSLESQARGPSPLSWGLIFMDFTSH